MSLEQVPRQIGSLGLTVPLAGPPLLPADGEPSCTAPSPRLDPGPLLIFIVVLGPALSPEPPWHSDLSLQPPLLLYPFSTHSWRGCSSVHQMAHSCHQDLPKIPTGLSIKLDPHRGQANPTGAASGIACSQLLPGLQACLAGPSHPLKSQLQGHLFPEDPLPTSLPSGHPLPHPPFSDTISGFTYLSISVSLWKFSLRGRNLPCFVGSASPAPMQRLVHR